MLRWPVFDLASYLALGKEERKEAHVVDLFQLIKNKK